MLKDSTCYFKQHVNILIFAAPNQSLVAQKQMWLQAVYVMITIKYYKLQFSILKLFKYYLIMYYKWQLHLK